MPEEYHGGAASISNLGMFGIDEMLPIIAQSMALLLLSSWSPLENF